MVPAAAGSATIPCAWHQSVKSAQSARYARTVFAALEFAARLPVLVMIDLLGLPAADEAMIRHWSDRNSNFLFQPVNPNQEEMGREQLDILDAQEDYFLPIIRERRAHPGADLISAMVQAEVAGARLTDLEVFANCNMMAVAGGGTSRSAISLALLSLQRFPDELAKLRAKPSLINLAAEEFLRFEAPTQRGIRTAREDFTLGTRSIRRGELLHIMIGAANRDSAQFVDPDRLNIERNPNRHATLGHSVHYCLGARVFLSDVDELSRALRGDRLFGSRCAARMARPISTMSTSGRCSPLRSGPA